MSLLRERIGYSRAELCSDAAVHAAGLIAVTLAVPTLIVTTCLLRGDATAVLSISVYGLSLFAMILCSALYNMNYWPDRLSLLKRFDHSAIYAKIAGTYTPFILLSASQGGWFLAGLWGAALTGIGLKVAAPDRFRWFAIALYLGMGWAGLAAGAEFFAGLSLPVLILIVIGGLTYTVGVAFYLLERLPFHNTIWHVFVLTASLIFYAAILLHVIENSA